MNWKNLAVVTMLAVPVMTVVAEAKVTAKPGKYTVTAMVIRSGIDCLALFNVGGKSELRLRLNQAEKLLTTEKLGYFQLVIDLKTKAFSGKTTAADLISFKPLPEGERHDANTRDNFKQPKPRLKKPKKNPKKI